MIHQASQTFVDQYEHIVDCIAPIKPVVSVRDKVYTDRPDHRGMRVWLNTSRSSNA
jgi:hypothetical protein